jgi:hypothetical protein
LTTILAKTRVFGVAEPAIWAIHPGYYKTISIIFVEELTSIPPKVFCPFELRILPDKIDGVLRILVGGVVFYRLVEILQCGG